MASSAANAGLDIGKGGTEAVPEGTVPERVIVAVLAFEVLGLLRIDPHNVGVATQ